MDKAVTDTQTRNFLLLFDKEASVALLRRPRGRSITGFVTANVRDAFMDIPAIRTGMKFGFVDESIWAHKRSCILGLSPRAVEKLDQITAVAKEPMDRQTFLARRLNAQFLSAAQQLQGPVFWNEGACKVLETSARLLPHEIAPVS